MVHRQLDAQLARHLLHAQLRADRTDARRARSSTIGLNRTFFTFQSQIVGPVFNRVWDTPDNGYAEKFKHSIEPFLTISRTSSVDNFDQIVQLDGIDNYRRRHDATPTALNNRFYAKRKPTPGSTGAGARDLRRRAVAELLHRPARGAVRPRSTRRASRRSRRRRNFSPIALSVRAMPTDDDQRHAARRVRQPLSRAAHDLGAAAPTRGPTAADDRGWSKRALHRASCRASTIRATSTTPSTRSTNAAHAATTGSAASTRSTTTCCTPRCCSSASSAFYNAQCCGLAFEYQTYNYGALSHRRRSPPITASSCRSRSPASATSRRSTAR